MGQSRRHNKHWQGTRVESLFLFSGPHQLKKCPAADRLSNGSISCQLRSAPSARAKSQQERQVLGPLKESKEPTPTPFDRTSLLLSMEPGLEALIPGLFFDGRPSQTAGQAGIGLNRQKTS